GRASFARGESEGRPVPSGPVVGFRGDLGLGGHGEAGDRAICAGGGVDRLAVLARGYIGGEEETGPLAMRAGASGLRAGARARRAALRRAGNATPVGESAGGRVAAEAGHRVVCA